MGKEEFIQRVVLSWLPNLEHPEDLTPEEMGAMTGRAHELWCFCLAEAQRVYPEGYGPDDEPKEAPTNGHS